MATAGQAHVEIERHEYRKYFDPSYQALCTVTRPLEQTDHVAMSFYTVLSANCR
jgi:hypothetical protein